MITKYRFWTLLGLALFAVFPALAPAFANEPVNWGMGLQPAASSSAQRIEDFHDMLMIIITVITIFVFLLLVYVAIRYNKRANPKPSNVTHHVLLEIVWTIVPVVILIIIAVPSFKTLYKNDRIAEPEMTLKIKGHQWYWEYEYPDQDNINFSSIMVPEEELKDGQKRLLSTDNVVVLPIDTDIAILVTASDVIHAWTIPAFGVKIDAVPFRTNETWFRIDTPGTYYGQCSEICGKDHAFMPIEVRAVSKEEFKAWVEEAKEEFTLNDDDMRARVKFAAVVR
ncbi:MAG: cytochrome c oxidase subunit II [Alphaproteobacteria bacterium]